MRITSQGTVSLRVLGCLPLNISAPSHRRLDIAKAQKARIRTFAKSVHEDLSSEESPRKLETCNAKVVRKLFDCPEDEFPVL